MNNRFIRFLSGTAASLLAALLVTGCASTPPEPSSAAPADGSSVTKTAVRVRPSKARPGSAWSI